MAVVFNTATAANVSILRSTNELFQIAQRRVATGREVFGAADDATRYTLSERLLSRSRNIDAVNNNISTALKSLESTDTALRNVQGLLEQARGRTTAALNAGSTPTIVAQPTANINETTRLTGYSAGFRLSITNDRGQNFTYTANANATAGAGSSANITFGDIANALAAANIGVEFKFVPNGTASRLEIISTDGRTGFTLDGTSSNQIVQNFQAGLNSGYDGTFAASKFINGSSIPTTFGTSTPGGLRFGTGGALLSNASTPTTIAANSSISFVGADGVARTYATTTAKAIDVVVNEINALSSGIRAEIAQGGRLSLRNLQGAQVTVLNGTGTFDPNTGTGRFNTTVGQPVVVGNPILGSVSNAERLELGRQYENIKTDITQIITNNVTQNGRNLLQGQGLSIVLSEFSTNAVNIAGVNTSVAGNLALTTNGANFTLNTTIETAQQEVDNALQVVRNLQAQFGQYASFIRERFDLNRNFSTDLRTLGDDLVAADIADESARLTALQTQQQFAVQAFTAGSANAQSLLRLLG